jgi:hypothetical protein
MRLFSRIATLQGPPADTVDWATRVCAFVNQNSDLDVTLWQGLYGYPLGTVIWSAAVEGRADLLANQMALMGNDGYQTLLAEAAQYTSPQGAYDVLRNLVHGTPSDEPPPVGAAAQIVTATPAEGKLVEAMGWGVEIADMYGSISGANVALFADAYGKFGQMTWIALFDNIAGADTGEDALMASADYVSAIDGAAGLFVPASGEQRLIIRSA